MVPPLEMVRPSSAIGPPAAFQSEFVPPASVSAPLPEIVPACQTLLNDDPPRTAISAVPAIEPESISSAETLIVEALLKVTLPCTRVSEFAPVTL